MSGIIDIKIDIDDNSLEQALRNKGNKVPSEIRRLSNDLVDIAHKWVQRETPRKTGKAKAAVKKMLTGSGGLIFLSKSVAPYIEMIIDGTRPHLITPKHKKALFWKGAAHPVKKVMHPGTNSNPFVDRGASNMMPEIQRRLDNFESWLTEV